MRFLAVSVILLGMVLGASGRARADAGPAAPLALDEPRSGLHLEIEGACQVRPADGGGAACQSYAASAHKSDVFAVVLDDRGLFVYSIAIFAERELGSGETRARLVSSKLGDAVSGAPTTVSYGGERFVRAQLRMPNGAAVCFITADDRPEVAIVMFATDRTLVDAINPKLEAAMRTLRRTAPPAPAAPEPDPPVGSRSQKLLTALLLVVFAVPVITFIRRAIRLERRKAKAKLPR